MQTIPEISNERRIAIKHAVVDVLYEYGDGTLPVRIGAIIRAQHDTIKLITYSSVLQKNAVSYSAFVFWAGSEDAFCVHNRTKNKFSIYYNDIAPNIVNSHRVRWNLAHELGHVVLHHHAFCNTTKLFRGAVSDPVYAYLEAEADYFAQLILVPHPVLLALQVKSAHDIRQLCRISNPAAQRRFNEYRTWRRRGDANNDLFREPYDTAIFHYYFDFIFKKECPRCGAGFVQRHGKYCPICGYSPIKRGDGDRMKYKLLPINELQKLTICPRCENEETDIEGDYCQICGAPLINRCTTPGCSDYSSLLATNARYCPMCGETSSFFDSGLLKDWGTEKKSGAFAELDEGDGDLPF